jgi:hypothetical protein
MEYPAMKLIFTSFLALAMTLVFSSALMAQNVNAPDADAGASGADVLAASNAGGADEKVLTFVPTAGSADQSYTIVIKDEDGDVVDTVFVETGNSPPVTIPAGGKAYIHDSDPTGPDDTDGVEGTATMT